MVNQKRVEQKLPLLIADGSWASFDIDRYEYRMSKFKRSEPQKYAQHRNQIITDLEKLKRELDAMFNGNGKRRP